MCCCLSSASEGRRIFFFCVWECIRSVRVESRGFFATSSLSLSFFVVVVLLAPLFDSKSRDLSLDLRRTTAAAERCARVFFFFVFSLLCAPSLALSFSCTVFSASVITSRRKPKTALEGVELKVVAKKGCGDRFTLRSQYAEEFTGLKDDE